MLRTSFTIDISVERIYLFCEGHVKFLRWEATLGPSWLWDPKK